MPSPELAAQLADLGGFAAAVFVILVVGTALYKRILVFGYQLDEERQAHREAEAEARAWRQLYLDTNTKATTGDHGERVDPFSPRGRADDPRG